MSAPHRALTVVALASAAVLALPTAIAGSAPATTAMGPSTVTAPYLLPVAKDVHLTSLLSVDDAGAASNGYEMVGIPDGLGAIKQGANIVTYMNHELPATTGIARAHGQSGAFVSRLVIDPTTGRVERGPTGSSPVRSLGLPHRLIRRCPQRGRHPQTTARRSRRTRGLRAVLFGVPDRARRAVQRGDQSRLPGTAVLRQRGDR